MSQYSKEFIKEIAERTKENLENYQGKYDVTHLINSAVGLIMIPHAKCYNKIENSFVSPKILEILRNSIRKNSYLEDGECIELRDLIKHIRNGIAHSNIHFNSGKSRGKTQIYDILIKDHRKQYTYKDKATGEKKTKPAADFEIILNISDLQEFMIEFSEAIISNIII